MSYHRGLSLAPVLNHIVKLIKLFGGRQSVNEDVYLCLLRRCLFYSNNIPVIIFGHLKLESAQQFLVINVRNYL